MPHPDLDDEQAHVDRAYGCLAAMRDRTATRGRRRATRPPRRSTPPSPRPTCATAAAPASTSTCPASPSAASTSEDAATAGTSAAATSRTPTATPSSSTGGPTVATPFYRATAADPLGLRRRRRFVMTGRRLDDLFDEVFDDPDSVDAARGGVPDPLLAELERARTGEMRDIVATIQAEQDVVIRAPLDTLPRRAGRSGHGQDRGRPAPRRVPALRAPGQRSTQTGVLVVGPEPDVPALHHPGAAVAGRDAPSARPRSTGCSPAAPTAVTGPTTTPRPR